ncbi:hypothetical protein, partial [Lactobacillus delbrueckii]|uniref:hypothetical protein n=1 Tax=Lactobacillus delbrueckii TaxID=1584 RepID=UPI0021A7F08C
MVEMDFLCSNPVKTIFLLDRNSVQFNFTIGEKKNIYFCTYKKYDILLLQSKCLQDTMESVSKETRKQRK